MRNSKLNLRCVRTYTLLFFFTNLHSCNTNIVLSYYDVITSIKQRQQLACGVALRKKYNQLFMAKFYS